jgi:hypothetical protein
MNQPSPSLLVLAWDDADPSAHAADATPTLPVLRQLAAHQAMLAVLPQLPAEVQTADYQAEIAASTPAVDAEPNAAIAEEAEVLEITAATEALVSESNEFPLTIGTTLLPLPGTGLAAATATPVPTSRIVGLAEPEAEAAALESVATAVPPAVAANSLKPPAESVASVPASPTAPNWSPKLAGFIHTSPRSPERWTTPAAPYVGSTAEAELIGSAEAADLQAIAVETPVADATPETSIAAELVSGSSLPEEPTPTPPATKLSAPAYQAPANEEPLAATAAVAAASPAFFPSSSAAELVLAAEVDEFAQTAAEVGPEEAADLNAPEDDLTLAPADASSALPAPLPAAPERATLAQALSALHRPEPVAHAPKVPLPAPPADEPAPAESPAPRAIPLSDNLHYRIIQYARFATHMATEQGEEFGAIYAPDWPTWLAALEISQRNRRPLVLHLLELAILAPPAEHGWRTELERYALRRAHTVLVATEALRRQVQKHYGPLRVHVVAPDDEARINAVLAKVSG